MEETPPSAPAPTGALPLRERRLTSRTRLCDVGKIITGGDPISMEAFEVFWKTTYCRDAKEYTFEFVALHLDRPRWYGTALGHAYESEGKDASAFYDKVLWENFREDGDLERSIGRRATKDGSY